MPAKSLIRKLGNFAVLNGDEISLLRRLCGDLRKFPAKSEIVPEGMRANRLHLIAEGWAARIKSLPDGQRQITAFLLPGDFVDRHVVCLGRMDHAVVALTPCKVALVDAAAFEGLTSKYVDLTHALWCGTLLEQAVAREWLVNLGRRKSRERIAHLICELHERLKMIDLATGGSFKVPVTQSDLADATGLTAVHVNRVIQCLRRDGVMELSRRVLKINDQTAMRAVAGFNPLYLHSELSQSVRGNPLST